jgi:hypothetical protein
MKYKITKSRPKRTGKGLIIYDDLNQQAWYDKEKVKLSSRTVKHGGKSLYITKNIRNEKKFNTDKKAQKYALELADKYDKPVFDRGTGKYITPVK